MANQLKDLGDKGASVGIILDGFKGAKEKDQTKLLNKNKSRLVSCDLKNVLSYFDSLTDADRAKMEGFIVQNFPIDAFEHDIDHTTIADLEDDAKITLNRFRKERVNFLEHDRKERFDSVRVLKGLLNIDEGDESVLELLIEENEKSLNNIKKLAQNIRDKQSRGEETDKEQKDLDDEKNKLKDELIPGLQKQKKKIYDIIRGNLGLTNSEVDLGDPLKPISWRVGEVTSTGMRDGFKKYIKGFCARKRLNTVIREINGIKRPVDGVLLLFMRGRYVPGWDTSPKYKYRKKIFKRWLRRKTSDWATFEDEYDNKVAEYLKDLGISSEERASIDLIKARFEKIKNEFKKQLKEQYDKTSS